MSFGLKSWVQAERTSFADCELVLAKQIKPVASLARAPDNVLGPFNAIVEVAKPQHHVVRVCNEDVKEDSVVFVVLCCVVLCCVVLCCVVLCCVCVCVMLCVSV